MMLEKKKYGAYGVTKQKLTDQSRVGAIAMFTAYVSAEARSRFRRGSLAQTHRAAVPLLCPVFRLSKDIKRILGRPSQRTTQRTTRLISLLRYLSFADSK